jgi:hypothetical protein
VEGAKEGLLSLLLLLKCFSLLRAWSFLGICVCLHWNLYTLAFYCGVSAPISAEQEREKRKQKVAVLLCEV